MEIWDNIEIGYITFTLLYIRIHIEKHFNFFIRSFFSIP